MNFRPVAVAIAALLVVLAQRPVRAADVTLKDAVNCKDFKHNADGSWYADSATLNYGPGGKNQMQMNFFGTTITSKTGEIFTILNEKCGSR